ncbi:phage major capsid protein [Megalodesulfovibrio gigas]|uniref:phage major capsid protein n=1 Tax=Megalodesulfovibrio gigas TaxID=879 RepID=UPI00041AADA3|nr:phage major capsid protein [Megalodesulfovibrio gigas]
MTTFNALLQRALDIDPAALILCDGSPIEALQNRLLELNERSEAILATADAGKRDLTDEEAAELDDITAEFHRTESEIARRRSVQAQSDRLREGLGRQTQHDDEYRAEQEPAVHPGAQPAPHAAAPRLPAQAPQAAPRRSTRPAGGLHIASQEERGRWGWRSMGDFAAAVRAASRQGGYVDPRLVQSGPTTYGNEGTGADGGYMIPPDFRLAIMEKVFGEQTLISRTDGLTTSSNSITMPKDETTPWQDSGGIQAYWTDEAAQIKQSKPALGEDTIKLHKLTALVPVTEELMEDAPSLDAYLRRKVPEKFDFKLNLAIVQGTGVGQPKGLLRAGSLVRVAKEAGQAADTVLYKNLVKMWTRMHAPCRANAAWLIHPDVEAQLMTMEFPSTAGAFPAYLPAGGLSATPYSTLMGRPILPTQACNALGDEGDIILADLSQYMTVTKVGGLRSEISIHLWFDYDVTAYRFVMRVAGQPWWNTAIAPREGINTLSCFVALEERAG